MSHKGPGKAHREGISLVELFRKFPNDAAAEAWFIKRRWPEGIACPHCGSTNVQTGAKHKTMPYRCREKECGKRFSPKTGTVMESSKLGMQVWMIATYLMSTSLKSVSSMKLHRDLKINQRSAWFLAHRLRVAMTDDNGVFAGPVEADETYFGGKRKNMSNAKRRELADAGAGRGTAGKVAVVGVKDRETKKVAAHVVERTDRATLQGFVIDHTAPGATVYTDEASAYEGLPFEHESVKHSVAEYVRGMAHTNGVESFWSMLKRAHMGTLPQDESEAPGPLRSGVHRTAQPARIRHHRHDRRGHRWDAWEAAHLRATDRAERPPERRAVGVDALGAPQSRCRGRSM